MDGQGEKNDRQGVMHSMAPTQVALIKDILREAQQLVAQRWCQGTHACDANGEVVSPLEKEAVSFCALGAVLAVQKKKEAEHEFGEMFFAYKRALLYLDKACPDRHLVFNYNDTEGRTQEEMVALFDKALTLVE